MIHQNNSNLNFCIEDPGVIGCVFKNIFVYVLKSNWGSDESLKGLTYFYKALNLKEPCFPILLVSFWYNLQTGENKAMNSWTCW